MPCNMMSDVDWGNVAFSEVSKVKEDMRQTEAMLCCIMRALEAAGILEAILADQDEKASGVSREQMMKWLSDHKVRDAKQCDRRDEHAQHTPVPTPTPRGV